MWKEGREQIMARRKRRARHAPRRGGTKRARSEAYVRLVGAATARTLCRISSKQVAKFRLGRAKKLRRSHSLVSRRQRGADGLCNNHLHPCKMTRACDCSVEFGVG